MQLPKAVLEHVEIYKQKLSAYPKLQKIYENAYKQTIETTVEFLDDGTCFLVTGDISAMWLRDSAAQITHYIKISKDKEVSKIVEGVINREFNYIEIDPYANGFNKTKNGAGHIEDIPRNNEWVFERKYEVDSLCYPIRILYLYYKQTGNSEIIKKRLPKIMEIICNQWEVEQYHMEKSPYRFIRPNVTRAWDTIYNDGMGAPVKYTGMTWSGFRPSDDGCNYGYLTASNMFAVVILNYAAEMLKEVCDNFPLAKRCDKLAREIRNGIEKYCIVDSEKYGKIYACETDGFNNYSMIDDANIPSLLSVPYIGYKDIDDEIYQNTRKFLLSFDNPYYFEGKFAKGIGSRHTKANYIWHMALCMQGLTTNDKKEKLDMLNMIIATDGDTGYLHESFNCDNPNEYTRKWFTWPNALFAEFVEDLVDKKVL